MSFNYISYLQRIVADPATPRTEYMRAWEELRFISAHQAIVNIRAAEYHRNSKGNQPCDKLTGGQNV